MNTTQLHGGTCKIIIIYYTILVISYTDKFIKMSESEVNEFYKLKYQYEEGIKKNKNKIMQLPQMTWREKNREFKQLKPKCINCKRAVGTIFKRNVENEEFTVFLDAMCGDRANPCKLNMHINIGKTFLLEDVLTKDENELKEMKNMIVKEKNDLLFGFITSEKAVDNFDAIKEELNSVTTNHEITFERYTNVVNNREKRERLKHVETEIFVIIDGIKHLVQEYNRTDDAKYVKDAVTMQITEMKNLLEERMNLLYSQSIVEWDDGFCKLIQNRVTTKDLEENLGSNI